MRDIRFLLKTHYAESRALVIGIDKYKHVSPLSFAVSDARGVQEALVEDLGFSPENVVALFDEQATAESIRRAFLSFTSDDVGLDDRVFVFFAGHGYTRTGVRGETGYLVPADANFQDLATLIRWDELTRNAELIRAKHMLFVMDACYGGLALTRSTQSGSARFLKDMMLRYSRQVLTAGKADELVADSGGPLVGHSVFTGHLLEGLRGKAATPQGVITANGLMSYVYAKVANDKNSNQTPHYGYFDGDGDFVLIAPQLSELERSAEKDTDSLLVVPFAEETASTNSLDAKVKLVKRMLAEPEGSIRLHDYVTGEVRRFLAITGDDNFKAGEAFSAEELLSRMSRYEEAVEHLSVLSACVAYWARESDRQVLRKIFARATDRLGVESGLSLWINLRWYPVLLQMYSAGIAAVEGQRYDSLADVFLTSIESDRSQQQEHLVESLCQAVLEFNRADLFKRLPGHERHYTPMSEYLFKLLQPRLDDALFIGKQYEQAFDEFEVLFALVAADQRRQRGQGVWGPIGRFGWKGSRSENSPLNRVVSEGVRLGSNWMPLKSGLFGRDPARFKAVAEEYLELVAKLNWW